MNLPTYPMRPINGGRFDLAYPKRGEWFYEPKYNGWRALVHAPTGTMFNRHGERLTIASEFKESLAMLKESPVAEWFDMEGLDRRHNLCRGSLVILDALLPGTYRERRAVLDGRYGKNQPFTPSPTIFLVESSQASEAAALWESLREANVNLGVEFYEGLVAKKADSLYTMQLRNSKEETRDWIKHRWEF